MNINTTPLQNNKQLLRAPAIGPPLRLRVALLGSEETCKCCETPLWSEGPRHVANA